MDAAISSAFKRGRMVGIGIGLFAGAFFHLLAVTASGQEPTIKIEYDNQSLPLLWQQGGRWRGRNFAPGANEPVGFGIRSNPNWHDPWLVPEGTRNVRGLQVKRWVEVPRGLKIKTWVARGREGEPVRLWRFPVGFTVGERLYCNNKPWLERTRTKEDDGWTFDVQELAKMPPGFASTGRDCMECHKDAGQPVARLPGHSRIQKRYPQGGGVTIIHSWYGRMRGSDTVFSWRPVDSRGRVLPQFASIVEVVG